jgi:hypothetical protein
MFTVKLMRFFCYVLEKKDDFDWGKYLMEGEEIDLGPNVDAPVSGNGFAIENKTKVTLMVPSAHGTF